MGIAQQAEAEHERERDRADEIAGGLRGGVAGHGRHEDGAAGGDRAQLEATANLVRSALVCEKFPLSPQIKTT